MVDERNSVLVVTGESSGEQCMAEVIRHVNEARPGCYLWEGTGGREMAAAGVEMLARVEDLSAIGPIAACVNLGRYLSLFSKILIRAKKNPPDLAVLVDFPDFNLRLAKRLKRLGVPVCYFISPQLWAWRPSRIRTIQKNVERMLVILPFEVEFYRRHGVNACYVGNPVANLRSFVTASRKTQATSTIALLPGSRRREIELILPLQLDIARRIRRSHPSRFFAVAAPDIDVALIRRVYEKWQRSRGANLELNIKQGPIEKLLPKADCAMIKSGTTTLQAMVLGIPFVMLYRMSQLSYCLLRPFVHTKTYCLANLVSGENIVREYIQGAANPDVVSRYIVELLRSPERLSAMKQKLKTASKRLGTKDVSTEAADEIVKLVENTRT